MVRIKQDYIEWIDADELCDLKPNEELEVHVGNWRTYRIGCKDNLTLGEEDMQFLHYGEVVDVDYEDIEAMYKIRKPLNFDFISVLFYGLGFLFLLLGLLCVALGV